MNPNFSNSTMNMPPPNPNPNPNVNPNTNPNADYNYNSNSNSISNSNSNYSYFTQQAIRAGYVTDDVRRREYDGFPTNDVSNRQFTGYNYTSDRVRHREYDGFPTTDIRRPEYDYMPNPVNTRVSGSSSGSGPVSGLSQREIEKERIRKEIIAEEMMRRRILEEEVRREMMLDRDLPIRGDVRIGGGSSMRVDPWRVPSFDYGGGGVLSHREADYRAGFSTTPSYKRPVVGSGSYLTLHERKAVNGGVVGPSEISRDKAIVLAKRRDNITDRKRKPPMTPPVRGAIEMFKKPKPNEGWSCSLCQITTTSERGLNDHLRGKKHQLRADGAVGLNKIGFGTEPVPGKLSSNTVKPFAVPSMTGTSSLKKNNHNLLKLKSTSVGKKGIGNVKGKTAATANIKKKFRYFCEVCQVGANSTIVFDAHIKGKKHLAVLSDLDKTVETALVGESSEKAVTEENGVLVEKSSEETGVVKRVNGNGKGKAKAKAKVKTPLTDKPKKKFTFFCEMCKVGSNSMIVFNTHKVGKKHLANLSELNKTDEAPPVEASAEKAMTEDNKELVTKEYFDGIVSKAEDVETVLEVEGNDVSRVGYVETGLEVEGGDAI